MAGMGSVDGGTVLVQTLQSAGINTMFGLEGGHIDPILHAARHAGMRLVDVRHEAVAGYAADAWMRTTGTPAACVVTAGPGFTNSLSAITSSYLDRVPVLHIAGATPLREQETNALQGDFDQVAMVRPVTKWAERATSIDMVAPMARAAIRAMFEGRPGPAFLEVPIDVVFDETEELATGDSELSVRATQPAPAPEAVTQAVELLRGAERPVVLAGTGALLSQCGEALVGFVERAGIPVYTNPKALGIIPGRHPLSCGTFTNLARSEVEPDVVLILGARHGMFLGGTSNDVIPLDSKRIQVDVDSREIGRLHAVDVPVVADCRRMLEAMLRESVTYPDRSAWINEARAAAGWHRERYADAFGDGLPLHPYLVASEVAEYVDERTIVVQDGGDAGSWAETAMSSRAAGPGKWLSIGYLGNLGMHQGLGIGAAAAHPDHRVICMTGDGSIGFQIAEFDTMVRHNLPIMTVVLNNLAWGMSYEYQIRQPYGLTWVELADNFRYDRVCEACGGHGEYVDSREQLRPALERALASNRPSCVNVRTRSVASPKTEAYMRADGMDDIILPYYRNLSRPGATADR
jgi:acetolactate synthase-1/2/3 large subunit